MLKFLPFVVFIVLAGFLYKGLSLDPRAIPSPFVGKTAPAIQAPVLVGTGNGESFNSDSMLGKVWVLNVWASWCRECTIEHPLFVQLANSHNVPIVGLNYKDKATDANQWLRRFGDPYSNIVADPTGTVGTDWGVYAVPETFVIDKNGLVQHKVIGAISPESMQETIIPMIDSLQAEAS